MTAIAAVLALSSTPSLAQDAATADAPPAPVVAPEPVVPAPEPVAAETAAPAEESAAPVAEAAPQQSAPVAARTSRATGPVRRASAPAARPVASAVTSAPAPAAAVEAPAAAPAPIPAPAQTTAPPPIPVQQVAPAQAEAADDVLPIAGAAGVGVLALVGGAVALNRRRRRHDEVAYDPETVDSDHVGTIDREPAPIMPLAARAAPERTAAPAGLDLSRYGRHTQAAYRGPTPDNPSLSLKRRLKRAAFFDRRERMAGGRPATIEPQPMSASPDASVTTKVAARAEAPAFAPRTTKRPASQPLFGFGQPAFQS